MINCFPGYEYLRENQWPKNPDNIAAYKAADENGTPMTKGCHNMYRGIDLGFGGYVYAEPGMYYDVALIDVAGEHPASLIAMNCYGEYTKNFAELVKARLYIKHGEFDKAKELFGGKLTPFLDDPEQASALAQALKIVVNSQYGLTSATKFDTPCNNFGRDADGRRINENNIVAVRGALFMKTLQDEVAKRGFTVAHIKTDSIKIPNATPEIISFCVEFAKEYGYSFEHEATYDRMCLVNGAAYIAKYATVDKCRELYGSEYVDSSKDILKDNKKAEAKSELWTATAAQFQVPYVFKKLFSHKDLVFKDFCEIKEVKVGQLYLDFNEGLNEGEHDYRYIGRIGSFCPVKDGVGGGLLYRYDKGKYNFAAGAKGYRWMESNVVKATKGVDCIDKSYYIQMVDNAIATISEYGDFEAFVDEK